MIDIIVPLELEGAKAIVRNWLKKVGDTVVLDEPIVELETDKVAQEIPAPITGVLAEILMLGDTEATPGAVLGRMRPAGEAEAEAPASAAQAVSPAAAARAAPAQPAVGGLSPSVRRAVKEHGVDPASVEGSGRGGRVTRADIERAVAQASRSPANAPDILKSAPISTPRLASTPPAAASIGGFRAVPHDRMRLAIAENMLHSVTVAPHVTAVFEADFSAIMAHRKKHKAAFEKEGINLTFTAYMIAASVAAMRTVPSVNSRWHADRLEIFDDINIGVGAALGDKGLIVPVVQRAQDLSLQGIAGRLGDLIARARDNKLNGADVRGGTFTISNHGVSGSLFASPIIINQPQSAILGVGKLEKRVVVREVAGQDTLQIRPMAYVSLTIDHRVLDGHQTNAWLSKFVETLEAWPL
ncbi:dihydrolipoamide acetyltransferase family protein [Caulobacter soli]|uniref:dihydrolipoamide acetyltransferase family protein n=1 Tax=Caulobacter soli TaxID=2708539 RepID=UPI0013EAD8F9|nr:2-oxo acid dehydrogenase subunit E2 [Caulobacter soli]